MAADIGIPVEDLRDILEGRGNHPWRYQGISYHAHPLATKGGFEFHEDSHENNIQVANCLRSGGHDAVTVDGFKWTCTKCGRDFFKNPPPSGLSGISG